MLGLQQTEAAVLEVNGKKRFFILNLQETFEVMNPSQPTLSCSNLNPKSTVLFSLLVAQIDSKTTEKIVQMLQQVFSLSLLCMIRFSLQCKHQDSL